MEEELNTNLISNQIEEYISYKQALGYQIKIETQELRRFAAYTLSINYEGSLTRELAINWVTLNPKYSQWYLARRLETIRTFAKYICVLDPDAQMPPKGIFGKCHGRTTPYIFTEKEIYFLMDAALKLHSPDGLRSQAISVSIGLLWATGMRPSELCKLKNDDVNLKDGLIIIKETKFMKSRIIPIHESTICALNEYLVVREHLRKDFSETSFFLTTNSRSLSLRNFETALFKIRNVLLIKNNKWDRRPPRLYDIRHTFACNTLLQWYKNGTDIDQKIIYLSTYLGHSKIADTYWYLTGTPELFDITSANFEKFFSNERDDDGK